MNPGQLKQKVEISRLVQGQDEIGQPINEWVTVCTPRAAVEPLVGREYFAAGGAQAETTTRIRIRYRPGITSADKVTHDGTTYNINSVIDYKSAHRELVLMCRG